MVRRVFRWPRIANELVSIQPMSLPSGLLFYLDYTYGTRRRVDSGVGNCILSDELGQSIYNKPPRVREFVPAHRVLVVSMTLLVAGYSRVVKKVAYWSYTLSASGAYAGSSTWSNS